MPNSVKTEVSFRRAAERIGRLADVLTKQKLPGGLRGIGEEIMTDIKSSAPGHGVPVDTGALRATGRVEQLTPTLVELGFGDDAVDYALVQHERVDYQHTVGEARYLVRGVERWQPESSQAMKALQANAEAGVRAVANEA